MEAGPHMSQWTHSQYFVAWMSDFFGTRSLADFVFAQDSQNPGFMSILSLIPVIWPVQMGFLIVV